MIYIIQNHQSKTVEEIQDIQQPYHLSDNEISLSTEWEWADTPTSHHHIYLAYTMSLLAAKYSHNLYHDPHSNSYGTYYEPHFAYEKIETGESSKITELVNGTVELKFISAWLPNS